MTTKFTVIAALALVLLAAALKRPGSADPKEGASLGEIRVDRTDRVNAPNPPADVVSVENEIIESSLSPTIRFEIAKWQRDHGYYFDLPSLPDDYAGPVQDSHVYQTYDNATLTLLAEDDDLIAATILGDRLLLTGTDEGKRGALRYFRKATELGGTYAAIKSGSTIFAERTNDQPEQAQQNWVTGLAWFQVASWLGDPAGASSTNFATGQLSDDSRHRVCTRAHQLRAELEAARAEQGLGPYVIQKTPFADIETNFPMFIDRLNCFDAR